MGYSVNTFESYCNANNSITNPYKDPFGKACVLSHCQVLAKVFQIDYVLILTSRSDQVVILRSSNDHFWSQSDSHHDWIYWNKFSMSQGYSRYWEHWLRHTSHWKVTRFLESGHVILLNNLVNVLKNLVKCHFKKDSQPESSFLSLYPLISISPFNTDSAWKPLPLKNQSLKQLDNQSHFFSCSLLSISATNEIR